MLILANILKKPHRWIHSRIWQIFNYEELLEFFCLEEGSRNIKQILTLKLFLNKQKIKRLIANEQKIIWQQIHSTLLALVFSLKYIFKKISTFKKLMKKGA